MIRRFLKAERGSVIIIFALCAMALAVLTALVMDQVTFYAGKRKLQSAADMAALMMMRSGDITDSHALSIVAAQLTETTGLTVTVVRGRYVPDASKPAAQRFVIGGTPYNAIQVDAVLPTSGAMLGGMLPGNLTLRASARAARRQTASIAVGSRLVRVEGGLSQALLNSVLGYSGKITVMDYNSLASAQIDAAKFLQALNTRANIHAVTFDDVLDADVTVGQVISAMADSAPSPSIAVLLNKSVPAYPSAKFKLNNVLGVGAISQLPIDSLMGGDTVPVNVGELLAASASLSNGNHQVGLNLSALGAANVTLDVGQKPQLLQYDAYSSPGTTVETSQVNLSVGALGLLKVDLELAGAQVTIQSITCNANGTANVTLKAVTKAADVDVKVAVLTLNLVAGSNETQTLNFSAADIAAQTWKPTRSGLGLNVNGLSVANKLLVKPVDDLLVGLGLNVAEADVKVISADCGSAGLVY